ncbi:protein kinase-like domain, Concanavalin A-like lectin/glucanase domain protein [Artemisia annua]|uniref:Protein kinase-like domain, Concanavalin A-like lectin/glucanase domain protein n=1 Tax=Artemisia annua TaxID=35608 RepID=A0A2U1LDW7_ARTAN|nr:protein kinase-like domain, Concanavalin A-like lectin/glucanase domain protein [Artemisia annua]
MDWHFWSLFESKKKPIGWTKKRVISLTKAMTIVVKMDWHFWSLFESKKKPIGWTKKRVPLPSPSSPRPHTSPISIAPDVPVLEVEENLQSLVTPEPSTIAPDVPVSAKGKEGFVEELRIATDNFTIELGSGGFGTVYKGIFTNGTPVAVKVLNGTSDKRIEEQFMAEVSTMGRTHHFNLLRLYGFCFESTLRALVYEFMINGSLDNHLFKANKGAIIEFEKLQEIALGTARGIAFDTE